MELFFKRAFKAIFDPQCFKSVYRGNISDVGDFNCNHQPMVGLLTRVFEATVRSLQVLRMPLLRCFSDTWLQTRLVIL